MAASTHPVSLPSIHEMFPAHLLRPEEHEYNVRHKYQEAAPRTRCSSYPPIHNNLPQSRLHPHHTESIAQSDSRPHAAYPRKRSASQIYSFDVLRSDPMNSSLQHLTSSGSLSTSPQQHLGPRSSTPAFRVSVPPTAVHHNSPGSGPRSRPPQQQQRTDADPAIPTMISFPVSASKSSPTDDVASDEEAPGESVGGKKHICPTCLKRFNRPSSLRIHVNTHTGATPFRCPWPNCGREFNVNSNMRRHYRNHTTPGFSRAQPTDSRRKRRRVDTLNPSPTTVDKPHHQSNLMPPISHFSPSDSEDDDDSDIIEKRVESRVDYRKKAPAAYNLTQSMARVTVTKPHHHYHHHDELLFPPYGATSRYHHQYPYSGDGTTTTRSFHSSSSPSSSSSSLPSPLLQPAAAAAASTTMSPNRHHPYHQVHNTKRDHKYNPSAPYMHSLADTRVSTALRPAYHS